MKLKQLCSYVATLLLLCAVGCKPSMGLPGAWSGTLDTGHLKLRLVFHFKYAGDGYKGTFDLIDQGRKNIRITSLRVKGKNIHMTLNALNAVYDGTINTNIMEMRGTFKEAGASMPLILKRTPNPPVVAEPLTPASYTPRDDSDLQGYWSGTLTNVDVPTRVAFKISEPSTGKFLGELDNVDQGVNRVPVTTISYQLRTVHIEIAGVGAKFDGTFNSASGEITGTWKQGPNTTPLILKRTSPPPQQNKP